MEDFNIKIRYSVMKTCQADWKLDASIIDYADFSFILDGSATFWVDGKEYQVHENQAIFIPAGSLRQASTQSMKLQAFNFFTDCPFSPFPSVVISLENMDMFIRMFHEFNREWLLKGPFYLTKCKSILYDILFHTLNQQGLNRNFHVELMKKYIADHLSTTISLAELASLTGLNPVYCGSLFRQVQQCTVHQYVHRLKIAQAEILLQDPDLNITQVAYQSGFDDLFYFSKIFKQIKGISPSSYRKSKF